MERNRSCISILVPPSGLRRGPGGMGRRSGVWAALRYLPGDSSLVSDRIVAGGEEVAVVEARVLVPQVTEW